LERIDEYRKNATDSTHLLVYANAGKKLKYGAVFKLIDNYL